jgi:hypothetical protein
VKKNLSVLLGLLFVSFAILFCGGVYETEIVSTYQGDVQGATIRYLRTNRLTGSTAYCYIDTFNNVRHNSRCSKPN